MMHPEVCIAYTGNYTGHGVTSYCPAPVYFPVHYPHACTTKLAIPEHVIQCSTMKNLIAYKCRRPIGHEGMHEYQYSQAAFARWYTNSGDA